MANTMSWAGQGRVGLQVLAAATACWWLTDWLLGTFTKGQDFIHKIDDKVDSDFLGTRGSRFLLQIGSVIILAFLGFIALHLRRKRALKVRAKQSKVGLNIWTYPVVLKSPFGILTLGDVIFISLILGTTLWYYLKRTVKSAREEDIELNPYKYPNGARWVRRLYEVGEKCGEASMIPMTLLWIPVSRGSPILNVIGVPFERAVRYHIWVGLLTLWFVIAHGILVGWYFIEVHAANKKALFSWSINQIAMIPGDIAWLAGIVMLVTALERVRRKSFDLFFIAHHLYLIFLLFFAFHCPRCIDTMIVPVLLFSLDRFMRMVQSRKSVDVLSAKVLRSGAIELTLAKPASHAYHALSFVYVRLPSVSKFMWHPFSVASSPLDGKNQIVIYIKPLGRFTEKLHDALISSNHFGEPLKVFKCPFSFKVGLEGPYGSESMFYLRYKSLVMIAGGIGVTPFLAIIKDILHRYRLQQDFDGLPSSIYLIICVKNADELHLLNTLAPDSIFPGYEEYLELTVEAYVTQEGTGDVSSIKTPDDALGGKRLSSTPSGKHLQSSLYHEEDIVLYSSLQRPVQEMSTVSSSGNTAWVAATFAATLVSYFVIFGLFNLKVENIKKGPVRVMLYMVSISIAVVIFGGGVMLLWFLFERGTQARSDSKVMGKVSRPESPMNEIQLTKDIERNTAAAQTHLWDNNVTVGRRPNWDELFDRLLKKYQCQEVGVMVSGVLQMQQDVAKHCKDRSLNRGSGVVLHYHSVSFEL